VIMRQRVPWNPEGLQSMCRDHRRGLTMKLRGRPEAPNGRCGCTLSARAHGA
jgi:hypothetical protein